MAKTHRSWMSAAVMVSFVSLQTNTALFASENESSSIETPPSQSLADRTSDTQVATSAGSASTISIREHPAAPDVSSTSLPPMGFSRFTLPESFVENPSLVGIANGAHRTFTITPTPSSAFAGQIYQGRPYRMSRDGSIAALMLGAVAAIAGTAVLVYANRPECTTNQLAGGCGYGTKVVGGAVLSGGVVGLFIGALTWR
jgi:hypothetical protein